MQVFTELNVQSSFGILVMYLGRMNDSCLILYFVAPVVDQTGCSDCDLVENCSEFSSTPNTSTHTTPEPSPIKKRRVEEPQPSASEGTQPLISGQKKSKEKDLSLLMASQTGKCMVPKDSLYFREQNNMARTKKTAHKKYWETCTKQVGYKPSSKDFVSGTSQEKCGKGCGGSAEEPQ